ncbi:MAG: hypothetical protein GY757_52125 [bacterium]|nr:hypothetical protein [bacterium]
MIMKTWVLNTIVQKIASDESALLKDRTLPARFLRKNLDTFKKLYKKKVSPHEQELIDRIPEASTISPRNELLTDMLHQLIKYKGLERKVSPKLIIPGKEVQRMKADKEYFPPSLSGGWREDMLGRNLVKLIKNRKDFDIIIKKDKYTLRMKDENRFSLKRFFLRKDDDDDYPG